VVGPLLEKRTQVLDRILGLIEGGRELAQYAQQESLARGRVGEFVLFAIEFDEARAVVELMQDPFESVASGSVLRRDGGGFGVDPASSFWLTESFFEDLPGAEPGKRALVAGEAGTTLGGDLQLQELEQLRPHAVGDEIAGRILERDDVVRKDPKALAHRGQALVDLVETDHGEATEAVKELRSRVGVVLMDDLQRAEAGLDGDFVAARGHGELFEVAPQREVASVRGCARAQQLDGRTSLACLSEHETGSGQRHRT